MSWKKMVLLNVAGVAGCFLAVCTVPPQTPLRTFLIICAGAIILLNVAIVYFGRRKTEIPTPVNRARQVMMWAVTAFFLLEVLLRIFRK
ncbi:MAG TPA: hypothetical protein VME18_09215 [Acidobacteriaceae bacterium]|nr:hypothetical protein [Acidobacteriaceae bacterium]